MMGFKTVEKRPRDTALGKLDRMNFRAAGKRTKAFRDLPILEQHGLLALAWDAKGKPDKASPHFQEIYKIHMDNGKYSVALRIARNTGLTEQVDIAARAWHEQLMQEGTKDSIGYAKAIADSYEFHDERFAHHMYDKEYLSAFFIAKEHLGEEQMKEAARLAWKQYMGEYKFSDAAELAKIAGLAGLMKEAALREFKGHLSDMEFDKAEAIAEKFSLTPNERKNAALEACRFSMLWRGRGLGTVLEIAKPYHISMKSIKKLAVDVSHKLLQMKEYAKALTIAHMYGLQKPSHL